MGSGPSIGVIFPARGAVEKLPDFAGRAEEHGLDELWVVEDCFLSGGVAMASTALALTRSLRVGIGLLPAAVRNPVFAAMEIATLARLYPRRVAVAFGHGVAEWMRQIGSHPGDRLAALEEVTSVVRALVGGETVSMQGAHVHVDNVKLETPPSVPPLIVIGTTGPKGLAIAGRAADGILLAEGAGAPFVDWAVEQASAADGGAKRPECVVYSWLRIDDDARRAREALRPAVEHWRSSGLYPEPMRLAPADPRELAVVGDAAACARAIGRLADAGARSVVLAPLGDDVDAQVERLAAEVLPLVRAAAAVAT
jgi:5,10-methylenetetrahydromethanopterin reductase